MVAATTHAPIQAILIVFKMTRDYRIILPLMTACVVSAFLAQTLGQESIYTMKLSRRGVTLRAGHDLAVLREIRVAEDQVRSTCPNQPQARLEVPVAHAMLPHVCTIVPGETLEDAFRKFARHQVDRLVVVDAEDAQQVVGMLTLEDVVDAYYRQLLERNGRPVGSSVSQAS